MFLSRRLPVINVDLDVRVPESQNTMDMQLGPKLKTLVRSFLYCMILWLQTHGIPLYTFIFVDIWLKLMVGERNEKWGRGRS